MNKQSTTVHFSLLIFLLVAVVAVPLALAFDSSCSDGDGSLLSEFRSLVAHLTHAPARPPAFMQSDPYLLRWLLSSDCDLDTAVARLEACLVWRREARIDGILFEDFSVIDEAYPSGLEGQDFAGRPVSWSPAGSYDVRKAVLGGDATQAHYQRFILRQYEIFEWHMHERLLLGSEKRTDLGVNAQAPKLTPTLSQIVAIYDLRGFNLKLGGCIGCIAMIPKLVTNLESYYPMLYYRIYYVNTPAIFHAALSVARNLMSAATKEAIHVFGYEKSVWAPELLKQIPAEELSEEYGGSRKGVGVKERRAPLQELLERLRVKANDTIVAYASQSRPSPPRRHQGHHHYVELEVEGTGENSSTSTSTMKMRIVYFSPVYLLCVILSRAIIYDFECL